MNIVYWIIITLVIDLIILLLYFKYYPKIQSWTLVTIYKIQNDLESIKRMWNEQRNDSKRDNKTLESIRLSDEERVSKGFK